MSENVISHFISADWSKCPSKRSVYVADMRKMCIRKAVDTSWDVGALLNLAKELSGNGRVLVGVDVVLGVPADYWRMVRERWPRTPKNFVDWLGNLDPSGEFFETVHCPTEWRIERPWFEVAKGEGGRTSFTNKVEGRMLREIDAATQAKPVFAVAGIPGTVGSGTRDFWKGLIPHLRRDKRFGVWPFEGCLPSLLKLHEVVLCETYPALAYAAALADELPPGRPAKTKRPWRDCVCDRLAKVYGTKVLGPLDAPRANEDDFDAHVTAVAVLRCIRDGREIASPEWIDPTAEGSMLLAGAVDPHRKSGSKSRLARKAPKQRSASMSEANRGFIRRCPIQGCEKEFRGSRGGWDAHVGSVRAHPDWLPGVNDSDERKRLFRDNFPDWFEQ